MAETKLNYVLSIEGNAAQMIIDKVAECRKRNISISQSRATQLLLCELYNAKQLNNNIKPCEE
jgi:hypothetical protein